MPHYGQRANTVWQCKCWSPHPLNDLLITHHTPTQLTWRQHSLTFENTDGSTQSSLHLTCLYFSPMLKCSEGGLNCCIFSNQKPKHTFHKFMAPNILNQTFCLHSALPLNRRSSCLKGTCFWMPVCCCTMNQGHECCMFWKQRSRFITPSPPQTPPHLCSSCSISDSTKAAHRR